MDIKMPSDIISGEIDIRESSKEFLRLSQSNKPKRKSTYVKIVVTNSAPIRDFQAACRVIAGINRDIPLILQPVSPSKSHPGIEKISSKKLIEIYLGKAAAATREVVLDFFAKYATQMSKPY